MANNDISVIIRAAGERTEELCRRSVEKQMPAQMIATVCERPFPVAIRKSFETALELGATWTLILDADVLLRSGAIQSFLNNYSEYDFFCGHALALDKFWGEPVARGIHFYRTQHLQEALECINHDPLLHKPGGHVIRRMQSRGHLYLPMGMILGTHDFEQYYRKIYIAMFNRACRQPTRTKPLLERFRNLAEEDPDFAVATKAIEDGIANSGAQLYTDTDSFPEIDSLLTRMNLQEKSPDMKEIALPDLLIAPGEKLVFRPPTVEQIYYRQSFEEQSGDRSEKQKSGILAWIRSQIREALCAK